jgi:hypothetical protein
MFAAELLIVGVRVRIRHRDDVRWDSACIVRQERRFTNTVLGRAFSGVVRLPRQKLFHRGAVFGKHLPAWSRNGRELFYLQQVGADGVALMAVDFSNSGVSRIGAPRVLFQAPYESTTPMRSYDVTQDGQFLIPRREGTDPDERITKLNVVLGWAEELPRKVPAGK